MQFKKEELIKSPLNYTGGKFKLLPQLLPLFPNKIDTFIDLFCGGCNVGVNVKANKIICNDINFEVINLMKYFQEAGNIPLLSEIYNIIDKYGLSDSNTYGYEYYGCDSSHGLGKYNKSKYEKLREDYNKTKDILLFYVIVIYSFSNQIRFNSKGIFNMPVGKRDFNKSIKNKLQDFVSSLDDKFVFTNKDFKELKINELKDNDFIYCDPPYLVTCATYNEKDGWNETKEDELLQLLDNVNNKKIRFALSNVLENKGKSNDILKEWSQKYNVYHLNNTYGNCNYHAKDKSKSSTDEVLITNYKN